MSDFLFRRTYSFISSAFDFELDMHFVWFDSEDQSTEMSKMWKYAVEALFSKRFKRSLGTKGA